MNDVQKAHETLFREIFTAYLSGDPRFSTLMTRASLELCASDFVLLKQIIALFPTDDHGDQLLAALTLAGELVSVRAALCVHSELYAEKMASELAIPQRLGEMLCQK